MQCNLDRKGRIVRLIWGLACLAGAVALAVGVGFGGLVGWGWWVGVAVAAAFGVMGIVEYRLGWCVMRAMGLKTPV